MLQQMFVVRRKDMDTIRNEHIRKKLKAATNEGNQSRLYNHIHYSKIKKINK